MDVGWLASHGMGWHGVGWVAIGRFSWHGLGWVAIGRFSWLGVGWHGMGWDGMGWDAIGRFSHGLPWGALGRHGVAKYVVSCGLCISVLFLSANRIFCAYNHFFVHKVLVFHRKSKFLSISG
ncbi:hypothetical protein LC085_10405 [Bacillus tianshenii]|uniref:hypothetical protein n=1 Tax=Sutcliffiella tianshenii TaxID=1463404 RepID=UPI001CD4A74A|nr:hypothetical protein [Bacillus tianshenii]MCA1320319.1 hypothetical protein [Bacillus tianshenii]